MNILEAFTEYQKTIDADPEQVDLARERRDIFAKALQNADDVDSVVKSGSLQRSTQLKPIHDVDIIAVFNPVDHPGWGTPGKSSEDALDRVHELVTATLGVSAGTDGQLIRIARRRNRAVKCFIDPPEQDDAFTVDVMPALRQGDGTLLLPSKRDEEWSTADPEYLIEQVRQRQAEWAFFRPTVRLLKDWRLGVSVEGKIKSLVMEVLALECLPTAGNRPTALRDFFTAAAVAVNLGVSDPADHCGLIQPDLDVPSLRNALNEASDLAERACDLAARNDTDGALRVWQELFGPNFPAPSKTSKTVAAPVVVTPLIKDAPQG